MKPAEVGKRLGMPPSTLRIYSAKFAEVLSESAARPPVTPEGKVGYRLYTERDLVVLRKAKELLAQGLTYDQVLAELRLVVPGRVRSRGGAPAGEVEVVEGSVGAGIEGERMLAVLARAVASAERSADTCQALVREIRAEIGELRERVERVEADLERVESKKGLWSRLFGG